jgi:ribonuclease HI
MGSNPKVLNSVVMKGESEMSILAIDGASRRNGKPDCLSAGSVFLKPSIGQLEPYKLVCAEKNSTNQRGELSALKIALVAGLVIKSTCEDDTDLYMITDSEYLFNTITKDWISNWERKGWLTADSNPVKNKDCWEEIQLYLQKYDKRNMERPIMYCVKGHLISIGKATAAKILDADDTGMSLYYEVAAKYTSMLAADKHCFDPAMIKFEEVNGFKPPVDIFGEMIICNTVADLIAGWHADKADTAWIR